MLERIADAVEAGMAILRDHPATKDRIAVIEAIAPPHRGPPLLDANEWTALKKICG
jgi:hypothetical protein